MISFLLSRRSLTARRRFICNPFYVQAAARRVAHYWKCRRDIFGDRAFLPMTLAGAMAEDLETLEKGLVSVPPPDQHGRGVIFWHRTRMNRIVASRSSIVSYPPLTPDPLLLWK
jgi:hypothetical protein